MRRFRYRFLDVFTPVPFRGNALAVFPDARELPEHLMQPIAAQLNLSETTFVLPSPEPECDYRVRIFTPTVEMPMAGHPTVGTAWVLEEERRIAEPGRRRDAVTFLEGVGPIRVQRTSAARGGSMWWMSQLAPKLGARGENRGEVAAALGLDAADLEPDLPLEVISCGVPFLLVPLRRLEALGRLQPRLEKWQAVVASGADAAYCFALDAGESGVDVRCRMFAPTYGVAEDPATGSAAGPLGCYLVRHRRREVGRMLAVQGVEIGKRSEIHIEIEGGPTAITAVRVGGECAGLGEGFIEIEDERP
jgi:trans-2,3-dihydro-3-hydroxyanthranilate isomerase